MNPFLLKTGFCLLLGAFLVNTVGIAAPQAGSSLLLADRDILVAALPDTRPSPPRVAPGLVLQIRRKISDSVERNLFVTNASGQQFATTIWRTRASSTVISSVAGNKNGDLVVSGYSIAVNGKSSYYLAMLTFPALTPRYINTTPYLPNQTCVAEDGSVWTLGTTYGPTKNEPTSFTVRHYLATGTLVNALLPETQLADSFTKAYQDMAQDRIVCGSDSVVIYRAGTVTPALIEINSQTSRVVMRALALPANAAALTGLAMSNQGILYASFEGAWSGRLFSFDLHAARTPAEWRPVTAAAASVPLVQLFSSPEGDHLAYLGLDSAQGNYHILWSPIK